MIHVVRIAVFLFAFSRAVTYSAPLSGDDALHFLDDIEKSFKSMHSLKTEFHQEKYLQIFSDKLVSSGVIYFQSPDKMRMEFEKPFRSLMIVTGNSVEKYEWSDIRWKKISVTNPDVSKAVGRQMSGWLTGHFQNQTKYYSFYVDSTNPVVLRLVPKAPGIKDMIQDIRVSFTTNQKLVKSIEIREVSGDRTIMTFSGQQTNTDINSELFQTP